MDYSAFLLIIPSAIFLLGAGVLGTDPRRRLNQAFAVFSVIAFTWFGLWATLRVDRMADPVPWIRAISIVASLLPWSIWWMGMCAVSPQIKWLKIWTGYPWILLALVCSLISMSEWFIPLTSSRELNQRGFGSVVYFALMICGLLLLPTWLLRKSRTMNGIRKQELQVLAATAIGSVAPITAFSGLASMLGQPWLRDSAPLTVIVCFSISGWALASKKIIGPFEVWLKMPARIIASGVWFFLSSALLTRAIAAMPASPIIAIWMGVTMTLMALWLVAESVLVERLSGTRRLRSDVTSEIIDAGRSEVSAEALLTRTEEALLRWSEASSVKLVHGKSLNQTVSALGVEPEIGTYLLMQPGDWATVDSLSQRSQTSEVILLREWLERKGVDFLAVCGESASSQCVAVKVGRRHPVRAFRSKEVAQMIDWLNLTETALARVLLLKDAIERERISSAGIMASGLAHEIRNPLMALKTGAEMLVEHSGDKVFLEEFATVLKDEIIHIEEMAEQLMNLTVPTKPILDRIDLNSVVRASVRLLSKRLRRLNISLVDETGDTPMTVTGNASAIGQVIVNLVINAQQAIAPAAKVRVVTIRTIRSGSETYLEVEDSGAGVPADQRANIFRPFTSTKVGGFGIGLPVCENIMRNHSGSIALLDTEGATTFRLTFME